MIARLIYFNGALALLGMIAFMILFGLLSGSVLAGLAFPVALVSMAAEGNFWGMWIVASLVLTGAYLLIQRIRFRA